jgi:phosphoglycerate dehydrogenase-like enzyme
MRIVLCYPHEGRHRAEIAAVAPHAEIVDAGQERIAEEIFRADIFCGHPKVPIDWDGVVAQGRLKWIQSSAAGMDHVLVPSIINSSIVLTSASGVLADQVAEHAIALITGWCRGLPQFFRAQLRRDFRRLPTRDLTHATVGIVGFGGVGRRLAQLLHPFKTRILATDLFPVDCPPWVEALWPADRLDDLLSQAEIVVLALALYEETRGLFNRERFRKFRRDALLVNVARGALVCHDALVEALQNGWISGAAIDVTDPEPLPPDSPLWEMENVIITPHVGGQSARRADDMTRMFCANLRRYLEGRPLINLVTDRRLGFPIRGIGIPIWGEDVDSG